MAKGKHDPAPERAYFTAHRNHMDRLTREGIVLRDELKIVARGDSYLIAGDVWVEGGATVRVHKEIRVVGTKRRTRMVQTRAYTYNVFSPGRGSIVRHDGPDEHRPYHHVHDYDLLGGTTEATVRRVERLDDVPTLAEVIRHAHRWCVENRDALGPA